MSDVLTDLLTRLRADHDLDLAVVGADGLVVAADPVEGADVEAIATSIGDHCLMMTALGAEVGAGDPPS